MSNKMVEEAPTVRKPRNVYSYEKGTFTHQTSPEFSTEEYGDEFELKAVRHNYYALVNKIGVIEVFSRPFLPRHILIIKNVEADYVIIISHRDDFVAFMQQYGLVPNILCEILPQEEKVYTEQ